jgi:hypothetical protein
MILNQSYIKDYITSNQGEPIPYRWTHGATENHLGDGLLVYSIVQHMRAKSCVVIGSGGGFIPRIITQARYDLYQQGIFEGDSDFNWGDIGSTYLVDACNGVGGKNDLEDENSFYRSKFYPRFIKDTSENAYYNFFVKEDIKIDLLFIDGDHSYDGVKLDFDLYSKLLTDNGVILIHDTDKSYSDELIISEDAKKDFHPFDGPSKLVKELEKSKKWNVVNLFNNGILKDKPSSTGITIVNRK